jgi:hypothetical protein
MNMYQCRLSIIFFVCICILSGCMGGGTIGTGVTSLGEGHSRTAGVLQFTLQPRVVDPSGKVQAAADVGITTSLGAANDTTGRDGVARLNVKMHSGDVLRLVIKVGKKVYRGSQQFSPAGQELVACDLILYPDGRAEVSQ